MDLKFASIIVVVVGIIIIRVIGHILILLAASNTKLILHKLVPCRCRSHFLFFLNLGRVVHDEKWESLASIRHVKLRFQIIVLNNVVYL